MAKSTLGTTFTFSNAVDRYTFSVRNSIAWFRTHLARQVCKIERKNEYFEPVTNLFVGIGVNRKVDIA